MKKATSFALVLFGAAMLTGCSDITSRQPPVRVFPDMKDQQKFKAQSETSFFSDGRSNRRPPLGTVAYGTLKEDEAYATGIANGMYIGKNPEAIDRALLDRGRVKYETYCAPCHSRTGSENGLVPRRTILAGTPWLPTMLQDPRVKGMTDGEIYHVATNGRRSMHGYKYQTSDRDRWAIVAYVRALQRATSGSIEDVPQELRPEVR
ncbi:MAG TPA: quinol:cytochrome C oxidoreductase [Solibacterales bacterium]|nr:quinol:cytochrome C oxidoreductase [Bryobacterales bacterium]